MTGTAEYVEFFISSNRKAVKVITKLMRVNTAHHRVWNRQGPHDSITRFNDDSVINRFLMHRS